jgi:hypothetical protein
MVGAIAMSADVGVLYFNWQILQAAADSGAVAGAAYLPSNPSQAITTANGYATKGLVTGSVSVQATAQIQTIGTTTGVTPIGIDYRQSYSSGQVVTLMQGQVGPGNWGPLGLGGTGGSTLSQNIEYGYPGSISAGDLLTTDTGLATGPIRSAFNFVINQGQSVDPGGTFANHTPTDPRVLIVPMVDYSSVNGSSQVPVKGFAALWLVSVNNNNDIQTYFINQVAPGSTPNKLVQNFGAYKAVLVQ